MVRILELATLAAMAASLLSGATISVTANAPTIGYANGPYWTFSPAPSTPVTFTIGDALLELGTYTYHSGALGADMLDFTLDVTPTVDGTTATSPLAFQGTVATVPGPYPYEFHLSPMDLPFGGYFFFVASTNGLPDPSNIFYPTTESFNVLVSPPLATTPEPGDATMVALGACLLLLLRYLRRDRASRSQSEQPA